MDIIYKHGDITRAIEPYIIHGCNAQGRMGSGVAKALMDKYPIVRSKYIVEHAHWPKDKPFLGSVHVVDTGGAHTIFNAITQEFFGYDGKLYASYGAIELCMNALNKAMRTIEANRGETPHVAMPLLGCGLAGGNWSVVSGIIERCSRNFQPVVYTLDGVIPGV